MFIPLSRCKLQWSWLLGFSSTCIFNNLLLSFRRGTHMHSGTSTSIHEKHPTPFNTVHRRSSSYSAEPQDSSPAGRPFAFVPKRRASSGTPARQPLSEDSSASPNLQGQIRLVEETTSEDSATPQTTTSRSFCAFPRIKPELPRERVPQIDTDLPGSTLPPDAPSEMDTARMPAFPSSDQPDDLPLVNIAGTPTLWYPVPVTFSEFSPSVVLPRKKSGELVKPSLKSTGFATWAASSAGRARTKSAPTTPMGSKSVHFDAHLEHIKLFLAEQKPLAVSRDGSPTETSEGDTTDTSFPFPRMASVTLRLKPTVLPQQPPPEPWTFDVRLEKLYLEDTALVGRVLVRNVAFAKWVAVRFTLDSWQTTSEVAARHIASLRDNTFDRFEFRVRLVDYMNGIESKRLIFCVRFSVEGQQMWDSNGGRNYEVGFEKVREDPTRQTHASALATDLRKQLEKVVQNVPDAAQPTPAVSLNRKKPRNLRVWLGDHAFGGYDDEPTPTFRPGSRSPSPLDDQKKTSGTPSLSNKDVPLSARYDFGASLRSPSWVPPQVQTMPPNSPPTTPRPKVTQRRPRSPPAPGYTITTTVHLPRAGQHRRSMTLPSDGSPRENGPQGSPRDSAGFGEERVEGDDACDGDRPRHHTRGWVRGSSFEQTTGDKSPLKKTPPGLPMVIPPTPPQHRSGFHASSEGSGSSSPSSPSVSPSTPHEQFDTVWRAVRRNEDERPASTPSFSTSSSSPSVSPLSPLEELPQAASDDRSVTSSTRGRSNGQRPPINSTPYYSFLDQYVPSSFSV